MGDLHRSEQDSTVERGVKNIADASEQKSDIDLPFTEPSTLTDSGKAWYSKRNPGLFERAPRAFSRWSLEEDQHLRMLFTFDQDAENLAKAHGRLPGAIFARLEKLQLIDYEEKVKRAPSAKSPSRKVAMAKKSQARTKRQKAAELSVAVETVVSVISKQLSYRSPRNDGLWSPLSFEDWDNEIVRGLIYQANEDGVGVHEVITSAIQFYLEHRRIDEGEGVESPQR